MDLRTPHPGRPWPPPTRPWALAQTWSQLLFAHWPVDPERLAPQLPPGLELDTYDGQAWIGVVPFRMEGVRLRRTPALPWLSRFLELNVRTYVRLRGRGAVWFFSLDASNPVAVAAARRWFHLPYFRARMSLVEGREGVEYRSRRTHRGQAGPGWVGRYRPTGPACAARPGSLEAFLVERYQLVSAFPDGLRVGEVHHAPWPLQPAEAEIEHCSLLETLGLGERGAPLCHFARRLEVVAWSPRPAGED